jgi:hypothetical protein
MTGASGRVGSEAAAWPTAPLHRGRARRGPTLGPGHTGTSPDYRGGCPK